MKVLQEHNQLAAARNELISKGVSGTDSALKALLRRSRLMPGIAVGEFNKSWDVLETLKFAEHNLARSAPILDIGCYASELIVALRKLGYSRLYGADLNPNVKKMPFQDSIQYEICNFMETPFEDGMFEAITSISVIEHGFESKRLLTEVSRLLRPGGFFISSFDYWPNKIDTTGTAFFGMDWKIFSEQEVREFIEEAAGFGLSPVGELNFGGKDATIHCGGKDYTFGWLALRKSSDGVV